MIYRAFKWNIIETIIIYFNYNMSPSYVQEESLFFGNVLPLI